jgi:hypothetical protein
MFRIRKHPRKMRVARWGQVGSTDQGKEVIMRRVIIAMLGALMVLTMAVPVLAAPDKVGFGELFYDGDVVRTVVPPAATPKAGRDNLYAIMGGAEGQLPVAAVAPGDTDYHGGKWAFHSVTWNVAPYLLDSAQAVLDAAADDDVTITKVPEMDFKCPIQPGGGNGPS